MQPKLCTKCKKNVAVVFVTRFENGANLNEGYCLKCARSLGIPQRLYYDCRQYLYSKPIVPSCL